jgi:glycosyltransferase involved in cell wall biosynthesis
VELSADLARALAGSATLTFIGPVALEADDRDLLTGAGALLLGPREHAGIPAYLTNADVLVVPHVVTEFTDSLDPIKVYEYLAAGRPLVSTPVAGFRELVSPYATVVPAADLVAATRHQVEFPPEAMRPDDVPSWDLRAEQMRGIIREVGEPDA